MAISVEPIGHQTGLRPLHYTAHLHTELATLRAAWLSSERDGFCTAYQRYAWVADIVDRLLPRNATPLFVELRCALSGETLMIFPLMRRAWFGYSEITWLSCGVCDYSVPVFARPLQFSAVAAKAAWASVLSVLPACDRLHIDSLPAAVGAQANPMALLEIARESSTTTSGIAIAGPPETVIARVCRPSFRKDLDKKLRKLQQVAPVFLKEARTEQQLAQIFDTLVEQRLSRFRQLGRFDLLTDQTYVDFYREAAMKGLETGSVRVFGLQVGTDTIATCYILVHDGRTHGILLAMDNDRWQKASPGLIIIAKVLEWARSNGIDYFDMSVGSVHYKEHMGADSAALFEIDQALTLKGGLVARVDSRLEALKDAIRNNPELHSKLRRGRSVLRRAASLVHKGGRGG